MRKRRFFLILGIVILAGVLVAVFSREREPEYGGKRLSDWVEGLASYAVDSADAHLEEEAIRQIGTNALPYLVKWLSYEIPAWKTALYKIVDKTVKKQPDAWFLRWDKATSRAIGAELALKTLGPQAEAAIGELTKLLNDPKASQSAMRAAFNLHQMRNAGLPSLLTAFTNQQTTGGLKRFLTFTMGTFGTNARAAVPVLMQLLNDSDQALRADATNALRKIDPEALERGTR